MQWRKFTRLKATGHSRTRRMLCCGRRKENGRSVPDLTASPGRAPPGPMPTNQAQNLSQQQQRQGGNNGSGVKEPVLLQGDFRKVSGISSEIFRQIEAVENDHDPSTAAALEAVERRGEMIVRILEPRCIGGRQAVEAAQKLMAKGDARHIVQLVEIVKRPGQTLGLYIREGNGADRSDGVFISRIALESAVYNSGCLRVGDEILAVNLVDVTRMSLDDVVIIMSIPRRLVLAIRQRRGGRGANSPGPPPLSRPEQKPPPVVVIKQHDLRDDELMDHDTGPRSRSSRERRTGDGREMTESRSRLGLGLNNYSPQSEQLDLYYSSRSNAMNDPPNWGYKPPPPPSVITEQPKGSHNFTPSHAYYQNAGTLESLAEKVHSFYPGQPSSTSRRMSTGGAGGIGMSQSHNRFPRSGSDQHLPTYGDYSSSLGRHSLLRSSLKAGTVTGPGGTLGRYSRYEPPPSRTINKYGATTATSSTLQRQRPRPSLDYSSDTEATIGPRPGYNYYYRPNLSSITNRGSTTALGGGPDFTKFNSLPRDRPSAPRLGFRARFGDRLMDDSDGNLSAPELPPAQTRRDRSGAPMFDPRNPRMTTSPSIFTSDEYRAWLRRAPSSSAICDQMKMPRDILTTQRGQRFSCSAENIHDVLRNTESLYSGRIGGYAASTLDRNMMGNRAGLSNMPPVRSLSSQHLGTASSIRSPSVRRLRQLLELSTTTGPGVPGGGPVSSYGASTGHQSPAPTPSTTLPRAHNRQIDINPAEFAKYKLDKPVIDSNGISGMLWIHLLAGRGLRSTPEGTQIAQPTIRDLYCVLECDRVHKARTVVRSGDLQFDWDESFELDLVYNKQLDVLVYSWDPQHRHKLCFRGALSLTQLLRQSPLHQLALKVEPRGTIYLRIRHTDPVTLYRRRGLTLIRSGYPQLFGADLETVVTREAKGAPGSAPVPIVLRRCVEEVERRGLDIIGLYRLCGSASKKRLLREAFERNSRAVELSPENVPDINVITGVLKDYLRELPEPLFTRCLFQMTVDALAVCLPDDPEGNAKLMLSILDCLPRANRATLVFLLDHLSLVVSASERNKMSAQALATVIGPPLMLHSSATAPGDEVDHAKPIAVLKYLLQIWPQPQTTHTTSGRRGEPVEQRGNKVSALQVARPQASLHISPSQASNLSIDHHQLLATHSIHQSQSAVGQLVQSPRLSPQVAQQLHQLEGLVDLGVQGRLPQPATPSPGSSSSSTATGSGSGTDTIKRGVSPATSLTSTSTVRFKESGSSYSIRQDNQPEINSLLTTDVNKQLTHADDLTTTLLGAAISTKPTNIYGPSINSTDLFPSRSVLYSSTDPISLQQQPSSSLSSSNLNLSSIKDFKLPSYNRNNIQSTVTTTVSTSPISYYTSPTTVTSTSSSTTSSTSSLKRYTPYRSFDEFTASLRLSSSSVTSIAAAAASTTATGTITSTTVTTSTVSPSRVSLSNTNTLPSSSSVARSMLYQSESSYSIKPNQQTSNVTSPGNTSNNNINTNPYTQTNTMNIYGTLPKTSIPSYLQQYTSSSSSMSSSSSSHFMETQSDHGGGHHSGSNSNSNSHTNTENQLGAMYRVQYSSTNPFLPTFNPPPGDQPVSPVPTISLNLSDKIDEE